MLITLLLACAAWRLAYVDWLDVRIERLSRHRERIAVLLVGCAAGFAFILTMLFGARTAGGADSFGYLSESALWLTGRLHVDQTFAANTPWSGAEESFAPLAYRPGAGQTMVPVVAPGLPLLMAGGRLMNASAPYLIAPACAGTLVILTYLLGRKHFSEPVAVVGAVLTAASPTVLYMAMLPMADVPAATFWIAALVTAGTRSLSVSATTGVLTGIAIAIRPNLAPLALFPALRLAAEASHARSRVLMGTAFLAGMLPFIVLVGTVNHSLYGSAFASGYGSLAELFSLRHLAPNTSRFFTWWVQSQGVLCLLFLLSVRRGMSGHHTVMLLIVYSAAVFLAYAFYTPFDAWWFLRFLLPAIPIALLLCADAVRWLTSQSRSTEVVAQFAFVVVTLVHVIEFSPRHGLLDLGEDEQRYADAGLFIGQVTTPNAVIITEQHSGSIRYYSGRLTLRFHWLPPDWLDRAIETLEAKGRTVYLLMEDWEVPAFRQRFAGQRSVAVLDRGPVASGRDGRLQFYVVNAAMNSSSSRIPRTSRSESPDISPGFWTAGAAK